jgi:hypothetical protein
MVSYKMLIVKETTRSLLCTKCHKPLESNPAKNEVPQERSNSGYDRTPHMLNPDILKRRNLILIRKSNLFCHG